VKRPVTVRLAVCAPTLRRAQFSNRICQIIKAICQVGAGKMAGMRHRKILRQHHVLLWCHQLQERGIVVLGKHLASHDVVVQKLRRPRRQFPPKHELDDLVLAASKEQIVLSPQQHAVLDSEVRFACHTPTPARSGQSCFPPARNSSPSRPTNTPFSVFKSGVSVMRNSPPSGSE
jgi:hypothetical protein